MGRWNQWVKCVIPYIQGHTILEIGHGPGHLLSWLSREKLFAVGLDESTQMGLITKHRLGMAGVSDFNLTRALAESIPFADGTFNSVVSTFPTEYIFHLQTLTEIHRVLRSNGRFIVLPAAWIIGNNYIDKCAAWLFKIPNQSPVTNHQIIRDRIKQLFKNTGFQMEFHTLHVNSSELLIVIASKSKEGYNHKYY